MTARACLFGKLIELGLIQPGQVLFFGEEGKTLGKVRADGAIQCNGFTGSIHQVARKLMNDAPCNGWEHWFYEDAETKTRKSIDSLRDEYIARSKNSES